MVDGVLVVDKPKGMTSHDVVDFLRRKFALKKVGHAGTLDPMATGVLVMLIGSFTRRSGEFLNDDKEYAAKMVLGAESDTLDAWGRITPRQESVTCVRADIEKAFNKFLGEIEQTPPQYSAKKHKGRKLYEFARKGVNVKVDPKKVTIKNIEILNIAFPEIVFRVVCSKGTYVRQLASDIGKELGCGAYLSGLRRMRSGSFTIKDAVGMEELMKINSDELRKRMVGRESN